MGLGDDWFSESDVDRQDVSFYDYSYSKWDIIPGTPSSGAGKDGYKPGTPARNPIDRYDFSDEERASFNKLRKWGEGPVLAAAEKLGITEVDNLETLDQLNDWLVDNYGDLFEEEEEEEEEYEPIETTPYERTELDLGETNLPEEMKIRQSVRQPRDKPIPTAQLKIR